MTLRSAENEFSIVTKRHKQKYDKLESEQSTKQRPTLNKDKLLINYSNTTLSEPAISVLTKGNNFSLTPKFIPTEEIIANVEGSLRNLSPSTSEEVRQEVCRVLRKSKTPKPNISKAEMSALRELRNNPDIIILPADKGNATVVLNTVDYERKVRALLTPDNYEPTSRNPTTSVEKKTILLLKKTNWDEALIKKLQPSDSRPPRFYGLPKIHKIDVPLRPIVSTIGAPTYALAKYLTILMREHEGNLTHHVKNSSHFIEILKTITIKTTDILVSFDVVSLFTKVPIKDTLNLLRPLFPPEEVNLFELCLESSYFLWNGQYYLQTDGVAMGNPLSPVMANFFMQNFEEEALATSPLKPSHWYRYVDDTFIVWPHGRDNLDAFLNHLNNRHPNIRFTMEVENERSLAFLDVLVTKKPSGQLAHQVYRKPTHTDRYLQADSNHHPAQKRSVIKTLVHRANIISDSEHLEGELRYLKNSLLANGYKHKDIERAIKPKKTHILPVTDSGEENKPVALLPYITNVTDRIAKILRKNGIKSTFIPTRKIQQELRPVKDKLDPLLTSGVYRIPCECGKDYIGMTKRSICTRVKEHERALRLNQPEKSAVAQHALEEGHAVGLSEVSVLARTSGYYNLARREALEIEQHPLNFNRDDGLRLSRAWKPALRNKQLPPRNRHKIANPQQTMNDGRDDLPIAIHSTGSLGSPHPTKMVTRSQTSNLHVNSK